MRAKISGTCSKEQLKKMAEEIGEDSEQHVEVDTSKCRRSRPGKSSGNTPGFGFKLTEAQIRRWNRG